MYVALTNIPVGELGTFSTLLAHIPSQSLVGTVFRLPTNQSLVQQPVPLSRARVCRCVCALFLALLLQRPGLL